MTIKIEPTKTKPDFFVKGVVFDSSESFLYSVMQSDSNNNENIFRYLLNNSIGDYLIFHIKNDFITIISSPGYSGAYFYFKENCLTISKDLKIFRSFDLNYNFIDHYLCNSQVNQHPYLTPYEGVQRLNAGEFIKIKNDKIHTSDKISLKTYLLHKYVENKSENLFSRLCEVVGQIHSKVGDASFMYSGGIDSTLIGMAIEENGFKVMPFTFQRSTTGDNNENLSVFLAKKLGWNVKIVPGNRLHPDKKLEGYINRFLSEDLLNPLNPHWGNDPHSMPNSFSGQNADAFAVINMAKRKILDLEGGFFQNSQLFIRTRIKNILYVDSFINNPDHFINIFNAILKSTSVRFNKNSLIQGLFTHGHPYRSDLEGQHDKNLDSVISCFNKRIPNNINSRQRMDVFHSNCYINNCLQHIQKYPSLDNRNNILLFNTGPLISYFLSRKRTFKDAINPKYNFLDPINKRLKNDNYDKIVNSFPRLDKEDNTYLGGKIEKPSSLMKEFFSSEVNLNEILLNSLKRNKILDSEYNHLSHSINSNKAMDRESSSFAYRLINMNSLLK